MIEPCSQDDVNKELEQISLDERVTRLENLQTPTWTYADERLHDMQRRLNAAIAEKNRSTELLRAGLGPTWTWADVSIAVFLIVQIILAVIWSVTK